MEHVRPLRMLNKYAKLVLQSDSNETTLFQSGLSGTGQTVALGDTGIDYDSCFFADPNQQVKVGYGATVNLNHRKVVAYRPYGDGMDDAHGHGTHVAGTLAGSVLTSNSQVSATLSPFNGMAPAAKIAMYDFKRVGSEDLNVPVNIYDEYYHDSMQYANAYLSSNSWGAPDGDYSSYCIDTDRFVYDTQTFLPVFAAGNYGEENGFNSISSPGISKNVLTVGSCKSSADSFFELGSVAGVFVVTPASLSGPIVTTNAVFGRRLSKATITTSMRVSVAPISVVHPADACDASPSSLNYNQGIVLVRRGGCSFTTKAWNVQKANGLMMIVVNNEDSQPVTMGGDDSGLSIVAVMIAKSIGEALIASVTASSSSVTMYGPIEVLDAQSNENNLSSFSSRGPTFGSRLKPDVLAPGELVTSVNSDGDILSNQCPSSLSDALISMQGTSMATPAATGVLALVRQYFMEGYYPTGTPTFLNSFIPSAALLKAVMIHSAVSVAGQVAYYPKSASPLSYSVAPAPSIYQGYGRVMMSNVLLFADDLNSPTRPRVKFYDRRSVQQDTAFIKCFRVTPPSSPSSSSSFSTPAPSSPTSSSRSSSYFGPMFRATVVWMDPPMPASVDYVLVNDVDLSVIDTLNAAGSFDPITNSSANVYFGNNINTLDDAGHVHALFDTVNNVEMISLPFLHHSTYMLVHVYGTHIPVSPQFFSLVVSGAIEEVDNQLCFDSSSSSSLLCPSQCSSHGTCDVGRGRCECTDNYTGVDCSILAPTLQPIFSSASSSSPSTSSSSTNDPSSVTLSVTSSLPSSSWRYYVVDLSAFSSSHVSMSLTRTGSTGDPDLYITAHSKHPNFFPTLSIHDTAASNCDNCAGRAPSTSSPVQPVVLVTDDLYRIGVYGYCCDDTAFRIDVTPYTSATTTAKDDSPPALVIVIISFIVVFSSVTLIHFLRRWYIQRQSVSSSPAVTVPAIAVDSHPTPTVTTATPIAPPASSSSAVVKVYQPPVFVQLEPVHYQPVSTIAAASTSSPSSSSTTSSSSSTSATSDSVETGRPSDPGASGMEEGTSMRGFPRPFGGATKYTKLQNDDQ